MLIEGIIICSYAIGCHDTYIYIRGEYTTQVKALQKAIDEAYAEGLLGESVAGHDFKLEVTVHRGAGAYVCGEETALLESIEGKKGQPRSLKPPFPAVAGLYGCPTIINNVQTIASLPFILTNGADSIRSTVPKKVPAPTSSASPATWKNPVCTSCPSVCRCSGYRQGCRRGVEGTKLKAIIPGGSSSC